MIQAYVLLNVGSGSEDQVLNDTKKIVGVSEIYISYGVYDLVVKIRADSMDKLKELITRKLRTVNNVKSTLTLILTNE